MNIFVCGSRWFGVEVMRLALDLGHTIVGVAAPAGDRLSAAATALWLPVSTGGGRLEGPSIPPGTDLVLAAYAHCYIAPEALTAPRLGVLAYHPSLLPRHRGRDAIRWTVHMRESVTGGTVYWVTDRVDAGPIAAQEVCFVRPEDSPEELWRRQLAPMGLRLFRRVLSAVVAGQAERREQDETAATWEPAFARPRLSAGARECGLRGP